MGQLVPVGAAGQLDALESRVLERAAQVAGVGEIRAPWEGLPGRELDGLRVRELGRCRRPDFVRGALLVVVDGGRVAERAPHRDAQASTGSQQADHLAERRPVVGDVGDHEIGEHGVEPLAAEGQAGCAADGDRDTAPGVDPSEHLDRRVDGDDRAVASGGGERGRSGDARPGADVENPAAERRRDERDEIAGEQRVMDRPHPGVRLGYRVVGPPVRRLIAHCHATMQADRSGRGHGNPVSSGCEPRTVGDSGVGEGPPRAPADRGIGSGSGVRGRVRGGVRSAGVLAFEVEPGVREPDREPDQLALLLSGQPRPLDAVDGPVRPLVPHDGAELHRVEVELRTRVEPDQQRVADLERLTGALERGAAGGHVDRRVGEPPASLRMEGTVRAAHTYPYPDPVGPPLIRCGRVGTGGDERLREPCGALPS